MKRIKRGPFWPPLLGAAIAGAGAAGGLLAPVGQYCSPPFTGQSAAAAQDVLHPKGAGFATDYADACVAAATQQSSIWMGLVVLGAAVFAVGLVWAAVPLARETRRRFRPGLLVFWAGVAALFVGVVGGWAVPVGADCSGAFGNQDPARIVLAQTGQDAELRACQASAAQLSPVWALVVWAGAVVVAVALVMLVITGIAAARSSRRDIIAGIRPGGWRDVWRNGPRWPIVLGVLVAGAAVLCGFTVPAGPYCSGAFTGQAGAAGEDIHEAFAYSKVTDYSAVCGASAAQMSVLWWVIVAVGVALVMTAFILRQRFLQRYAAGLAAPAAAAPSAPQPLPSQGVSRPAAAFSVAAELAQLADLRDRGVLTQEEFEAQKARVLAL